MKKDIFSGISAAAMIYAASIFLSCDEDMTYPVTVSGYIKTAENKPCNGAQVIFTNVRSAADKTIRRSDDFGFFAVSLLKGSEYTLEVSKSGYTSVTETVCPDAEPMSLNIILSPAISSSSNVFSDHITTQDGTILSISE
jgi:hypothetical protein